MVSRLLLNSGHERPHDLVVVELVVAIATQVEFGDVLDAVVVIASFEKAALEPERAPAVGVLGRRALCAAVAYELVRNWRTVDGGH